jgi:hypothetical protein
VRSLSRLLFGPRGGAVEGNCSRWFDARGGVDGGAADFPHSRQDDVVAGALLREGEGMFELSIEPRLGLRVTDCRARSCSIKCADIRVFISISPSRPSRS